MKITNLLASMAMLLLVSCGPPSKESTTTNVPAKPNPEEIKAVIDQTNKAITSALNAGNIDEASQYFAEDLKQFISGQPPSESRQAWVASQNAVKDFGEWDLQLEIIELDIPSNDMVVERGVGIQTFTANENSPIPSFKDTGNYMVVWKMIDKDWKIQWDYVVLGGN